ncbi:MAG TPA: HEAT repeat domain-containing protein [Methanocorpusculum sp.]|nr:HEAT repeat domain-containing protein [Methanocorpusculum sp.]
MKEAVFLRLVEEIKSDNPEKQEDAANKICGIKDRSLLPLINRLLFEDENPLVRRVMLWTLHNYPRDLAYKEYLPYLASDDFGVREAAQRLFIDGGKAAVDVLVSAVQEGDAAGQFSAVEALGQFRDSAAVKPLIFAAQLPDAEIREIAVMSLGIYPDDEVTSALFAALDDTPAVRLAALSGLKDRTLTKENAAKVASYLSDADEEIRAACVYVLDAHTPDSAANDASARVRRAFASVTLSEEVLTRLCGDADSSVRTAAADALGKQKAPREDVLIPLLKDEVPGVRRAAAAALVCSKKPETVQALIDVLNDPKPGIRLAAANSLGEIGGTDAIAALRSAMQVKNPILAGMIKNALEKAEKKN